MAISRRERRQLLEDWSALVEDFLKRTGLSETEVAERIGCDRTLINKWRRKRSLPGGTARKAFEELCRQEGVIRG